MNEISLGFLLNGSSLNGFSDPGFTYHGLALLVVVLWPLLLAIPALHTRLPWPRHLAIIPAMLLALFPGDASLTLSHILFGSGFAIDGDVRWVLLVAVTIWLMAATVATTIATTAEKNPIRDLVDDRRNTFFMLTLAGNLGAILTGDLVGFFSFSTLMGYGFYGLLLQNGDKEIQRAAHRYLIFLIIADLFLFETLLFAALTTEDLHFESVRQTMAATASAPLYIWMTLIGFTLKAGIWPAHLWLLAVFRSARRSTLLLLGAVPIGMGLLGTLRWLPLGEHAFVIPGTVMQIMGAAGMLYATFRLFSAASAKLLPVWVAVASTGLFVAALGTGLTHPALWSQYEHLAYPFIALVVLFLTAAIFASSQLPNKHPSTDLISLQEQNFYLWAGRWMALIQQWTNHRLLGFQSLWHSSRQVPVKYYQRALEWKVPEGLLADWRSRIILFVLLGLTLAWLGS